MKTRRKNATGDNGKRKRRANGGGTLMLQRGIYYALWYVIQADGTKKRICRSTGEHELDKAREKLEKFTADFGMRNAIGRDEEDRAALAERLKVAQLTVAADAAKLAEQRRAAMDALPALPISHAWTAYKNSAERPDTGERTLSDYEGYVGGLETWIAANHPAIKELRQITRTEAEAYATYLRANRSAGTFNKRIVFFRHFWRVLSDDAGKDQQAKDPAALPAKLAANPWEKIQKREADIHTRRELTVEELTKVCTPLQGEMRLLFAIGIYTGLRLGDCALLEWGAVDMVRGRISTIPRKTKRHAHGTPVVIPLHPTLFAMLDETPKERRTGYVLPETADAYIRESSLVTNRIQKHFEACGIHTKTKIGEGRRAQTDVGFHSLRHTFVSLMGNAGAPLALVQAIVGHSNPKMTAHYFHARTDALANAVGNLPAVIGGEIDAGARTSPPERAEATAGATTAQETKTRLEAFYAAYDALTEKERKAAKRWIAER